MWLWSLEQHLAGRAPDRRAGAHGRARRPLPRCVVAAPVLELLGGVQRRRARLDARVRVRRARRRRAADRRAVVRRRSGARSRGARVALRHRRLRRALARRRARRLEHPLARRPVRRLRGRRPARRRDRRRGEAPADAARAAASTATAATPTTAAASGCCSPRRSRGTTPSPADDGVGARAARVGARAGARERRPARAGDGRLAVRRRRSSRGSSAGGRSRPRCSGRTPCSSSPRRSP